MRRLVPAPGLYVKSHVSIVNPRLTSPRAGSQRLASERRVIDALLELRQNALEPFVVSGRLVIMHRAFDDQVFNVRLNVQPDERLVVFRIQNPAILIDHRPMPVVHLLDQFVETAVCPLCIDDKIQEGTQVVFPMAEPFHVVDVVPNPVVVAHQNPAVDKDEPAFVVDRLAQLEHHFAQCGISGRQDSRQSDFRIVIQTARLAVDPHGRQRMLKANSARRR